MRSAIYALHLGVCLLAGQACAFVCSPSGRAIASVGPKGASRAPAGIVMQATSNVESSVSRYKKLVGAKRWETDEGIEKRAAGTFAEMCKIYGEDNAVQMVKNSPSCLGYDGSVFQATFEAFTEVFGEEETKGCVCRMPHDVRYHISPPWTPLHSSISPRRRGCQDQNDTFTRLLAAYAATLMKRTARRKLLGVRCTMLVGVC
ncbi:unnamed protein product [Ectocarpus sp. 8 AP-2014]